MTSRGKRHALNAGSSELLFVVGQGSQQVAAVRWSHTITVEADEWCYTVVEPGETGERAARRGGEGGGSSAGGVEAAR